MKWVLIMWAVWPNADLPVKMIETYHSSEQACLDAMELVIERYMRVEHDSYGYTLQCRPNREVN